MSERLLQVLSNVLELEPSEVHDDLSPAKVASWDSFTHVMLISNLEATFGIRISPAEAISIRSVRDIRDILRRHGAEA